MNECRKLSAEEWASFSAVFSQLGFSEPEDILRFVDSRLGKVYDVFLLGGKTVLKKSGRDHEKYDRYFAGLAFAVPKILDSFQVGEDVWITMEYARDSDARDCLPEEAARVGRELAKIQSHYLASGGHTKLSDYYFTEYVADFWGKVKTWFPDCADVFQMVERRFYEAPHSLIHDDLLPINVLVGEKITILDWATAGIFPYFLDLARFAFVHDGKGGFYISHEAGMTFLDGYYEEMRKNPGFSIDKKHFYQDVAISAFCQYAMFLYYEEDTEHIRSTVDYRCLEKIVDYLMNAERE